VDLALRCVTFAPDSTEAPTVSVVLRTYGHERYVAQAIESVLIQDAPFSFELVIGEDCSTDGTRAIVESYARRHPDLIRAVLPERNLGHGEIFRRALAAASGDYIAYLDGDDYWTSRSKLRRQVEYLERRPRVMSCFHDVSLIYDEAGHPSGALSPCLADDCFTLEDILLECFVPAPAILFRRAVKEALPDWTFDSPWIDWLIHIRSAMLGDIGYLPEALAAYRVHSGGMFSALDRVTQLEEDLPVYERLLAELPAQRELIERCMTDRHCQLAIERLAIPFDACVILVDPRREIRPYFNGRHARALPRRDARPITEIEASRNAAATLSTATRDYAAPAQLTGGSGSCYAVVPRTASAWMADHPQLGEYLAEQGESAWSDEWCSIYELAPASEADADDRSRARSRVDVTLRAAVPGLVGGHVDAPLADALLPTHAIPVVGWVLGDAEPVVAIELECEGALLWRAPLVRARPDVAKAFPGHRAKRVGFQTTLNALELAPNADVEMLAVLASGDRLPFATLRVHRSARGEPQAANG
jgi:Glycosyl transferase family 2